MMPATRCSGARATGLVDDLLTGFTTSTIQQKLRQVCAKDSDRNCQSPFRSFTQGRDDSKVEAQIVSDAPSKISSKLDAVCAHGKLSSAEGKENQRRLLEASRRKPTVHRLAFAGANEQLAKKMLEQAANESNQLAETAAHGVTLSKTEALSLQMELLKAFTAPDFQNKLHELVRLHNAIVTKKRAEYHLAFRKLVRSEQLPIIERYGFKASEEGLIDVLQKLEQLREDADISVNSEAIREALFGPSTPATSAEPVKATAGTKPRTRTGVINLLRSLHENYSLPEFQASVNSLKETNTLSWTPTKICVVERFCDYRAGGYYHLPGRAELTAGIQEYVLPLHGFEGSKEGVSEMISFCANFLGDPDVASLFDAINSKLGMSPAACQRFRKLAAGLAEMK